MLQTATNQRELHPQPLWQGAFFGVLVVSIGYPLLRAVLPGTVRIATLIPLVLVLLWLVWKLLAPRTTVQTPLAVPLLVCSSALSLSSLFGVANQVAIVATLFDWLQVGVLLFLCLDLLAAGVRPRLILSALFAVLSFFLMVGVWSLGGWLVQWLALWQSGDPLLLVSWRQPVGGTHPNLAALLTSMGIPLAIAALWLAERAWQRWLWLIWLLCAVLVLVFAASRGGWLSMAAVSAAMVVPLAWSALRQRAWRRLGAIIGLSGLYAAVFIALFLLNLQQIEAARNLAPRDPPSAAQTAAPVLDTQTVSRLADTAGRQVFWQRALEFFKERPLLGVGPDGYTTRYASVEPHSRFFRAPHPHSIYLALLSESGIVGVLAVGGLALTALWVGWRGWRTAAPLLQRTADNRLETPPDGRIVILAGTAVLLAVLVQGLVEVPTIDIVGLALIAVAASLGAAGAWQSQPRSRLHPQSLNWWQRVQQVHPLQLAIALAAVLAWGMAIGIFLLRSDYEQQLSQARLQVQQGDLEAARATYARMLARYPWGSAAASEYATTLAWLAQEDAALLPAALAAQERARTADPTNRNTPVNQAALLLTAGRNAEATALLDAYVADDRQWAAPHVLLAQIHAQQGDVAAVTAAWQRALALQPDLAESRACLASTICTALPLPSSEYAALVQARMVLAQPTITTDAVTAIEQQAIRWNSIDLWAVAAQAATRAGMPLEQERALQAAQDLAQSQGQLPTRQLALVLLADAQARDDTATLRQLVEQWIVLPDMTLVPQLTQPLTSRTEQQLAAALVQAAAQLEDADLLARATAYAARVAAE